MINTARVIKREREGEEKCGGEETLERSGLPDADGCILIWAPCQMSISRAIGSGSAPNRLEEFRERGVPRVGPGSAPDALGAVHVTPAFRDEWAAGVAGLEMMNGRCFQVGTAAGIADTEWNLVCASYPQMSLGAVVTKRLMSFF